MLIFDDIDDRGTDEERLIWLKKLASLGRLSANLAHELNNPMDGVLRYVRLLLDQIPEHDPRRTYAERARDGLMRMASMVREILDFTKQNRVIFRPTDIQRSIGRILLLFGDQISAQNIKVESEFDKNIPVILNADVEQIFTNIIINAIQAMPNGGTLSISVKMLSQGLIEARFSDTGPGIPDEIRERIFEPFFTTKNIEQGIGLGLSISQEIAKNYDGSIHIESELGKRTTFVVRLPIGKTGLSICQVVECYQNHSRNLNW
jgi:signal transduction histidine kinase